MTRSCLLWSASCSDWLVSRSPRYSPMPSRSRHATRSRRGRISLITRSRASTRGSSLPLSRRPPCSRLGSSASPWARRRRRGPAGRYAAGTRRERQTACHQRAEVARGARSLALAVDHGEQVAELAPLRGEIAAIRRTWRDLDRYPLDDLESVERDELLRVVGEDTGAADAEIQKDLYAHTPLPLVGLEPEPLVGLHRVQALIL